jgi:hypothetical protein
MKTKVSIYIFIITLIFNGILHAKESKSLEDTFWDYVAATAASDGHKAANFFSDYAYDYWDQLLKVAKEMKRDELVTLPTYQISSVLFLRHRIKNDPSLMDMDGRKFVILSYSRGWNSQRLLSLMHAQPEMFAIIPSVNGDSATIKIKYQGNVLPTPLLFIMEKGQWKVDSRKQFLELEIATEKKRKEAGLDKRELCEMIFKNALGQPVTDELWEPLKQ